jgi:hypothetical protein
MYSKTNKMNVMKKIISYAACLMIVTSVAAAPGSKLVQTFNETFPNAKNVKWSDDKAGYFVSFYLNENLEKILYNKDGEFVSSWKYSDGKELPVNIVMTLNKKYNQGKIIGVTELDTQENTNYEVKLTKGTKLYSVTLSADGAVLKEDSFKYQDSASK